MLDILEIGYIRLGHYAALRLCLMAPNLRGQRPMMSSNVLKGNDRIGLMKLFLASLTKALPIDGPTDGWTHEDASKTRPSRPTMGPMAF